MPDQRGLGFVAALVAGLVATSALHGQATWLKLTNESSARLIADPAVLFTDNIEKDFASGDFDKDGWVDVAMARKFPGSLTGGFRNVLFMNEGGVLVERTNEYASTSDLAPYHGFLDATNDRDIIAVDINNDSWLDLITATTMSDGVIDVLGQPRAYINLGNNGSGQWLGFRHERNRIPHIFPPNNNPTANPRFCAVAAGDFNNDGFMDLFFVDYDTPETSGTETMDLNGDGDTNDPGESQQSPSESIDFNNKLLLNFGTSGGGGPGFFFDSTNTVCTTAQLASAFGNAVVAGDFSGDGKDDIMRVSTLGGDGVGLLTRKTTGTGFLGADIIYQGGPYNIEKADLNGDGKLDLVIADDGQDRYAINTGNDALGQPNFTTFIIAQSLGNDFGNQVCIADFDKDTHPDVVIVDVDADLPSFCPTTGRRTHVYRNVFNGGGNSNMLVESNASFSKPFTDTQLQAWFDVAPMDVDNDGWLDMVVGRCSGVEVWMNRQVNVTFSYPSGKPTIIPPGAAFTFPVAVAVLGGGTLVNGSVVLHSSVNGGAWTTSPLVLSGNGNWIATLPALQCDDAISYYLDASATNGGPYHDPINAPFARNFVSVGEGSITALAATFESGADGFTVVNTAIAAGMQGWQVVTPIATTLNGKAWAPGTAASGTKAMVTMNGSAGGGATASDLDGGPTIATSSTFSLVDVDHSLLSYSRWYANDDSLTPTDVDPLVVEISNNGGGSWSTVETVASQGNNAWKNVSFLIEDIITPTATMQLRFRMSDNPDNSVAEAAFDNVSIVGAECAGAPLCPGDIDGDEIVGAADLSLLLGNWGSSGIGDLTGDGVVNAADLAALLGAWGACS